MGSIDNPYSTGIFETIVGVHFKSGLAVEFFDQPEPKSFIELDQGIPNFKKAIIAMWFRAPLSSLQAVANKLALEQDKALASGDLDTYPYPRLVGYLPLVVFGPMFNGYAIKLDRTTGAYVFTHSTASYNEAGGGYTTPVVVNTVNSSLGRDPYAAGVLPQNPSFIGIRSEWVRDNDGKRTNQLSTTLHVRIQMGTVGVASDAFTEVRQLISDSVALISHVGAGAATDTAFDFSLSSCRTDAVFPGGTELHEHSLADYSSLYVNKGGKEAFEGQAAKFVGDQYPRTITPNHWHQAIISLDIDKKMVGQGRKFVTTFADCPSFGLDTVEHSDVRRITNPCKLWVALDDVNYTDVDVNKRGTFVRGIGANDISTDTTYAAASNLNEIGLNEKTWDVTGQVRVDTGTDDFTIPTYSFTPDPVPSHGHPIGIPCVSSLADPVHHVEMGEFKMWVGKSVDTGNASARRLFIDKNGKPVADPKVATKALGQPIITFHGSDNWIKGKNTGTGGKFTPTGKIKRYKPDPSLRGKQGDPQ